MVLFLPGTYPRTYFSGSINFAWITCLQKCRLVQNELFPCFTASDRRTFWLDQASFGFNCTHLTVSPLKSLGQVCKKWVKRTKEKLRGLPAMENRDEQRGDGGAGEESLLSTDTLMDLFSTCLLNRCPTAIWWQNNRNAGWFGRPAAQNPANRQFFREFFWRCYSIMFYLSLSKLGEI